MSKLFFLGTSNAISDEHHENTHMVLVGEQHMILIDCVDSTVLRLKRIGLDLHRLSDLILTHFHPDHVSGVPQLLMNMWLMGRILPLNIYGLQHTLSRIEDLMGLYGMSEWPNFFPVEFKRLPSKDIISVLECDEFHIFAVPMKHLIPTIGLRIEFLKSKKVLAYSCDTEPCPQVICLAQSANILIHEAAGVSAGHSSAEQAGEAATRAKVNELYLIHYPAGKVSTSELLSEARRKFKGPVRVAEDFGSLNMD